MSAPHSPTSRFAAGSIAALTAVQAARLATGDQDPYIRMLLLALVVVLAGATFALARDNGVEARLAAGLSALLCGGTIALDATIGLPGQARGSLGAFGVVTLALACAIVVLLTLDERRRADVADRGSSYAS